MYPWYGEWDDVRMGSVTMMQEWDQTERGMSAMDARAPSLPDVWACPNHGCDTDMH